MNHQSSITDDDDDDVDDDDDDVKDNRKNFECCPVSLLIVR